MSEQQQEPGAAEVEATGSLDPETSTITVEARLGRAELTLSWIVDEADDIDTLINSAGQIAQQVLLRIHEAQEADRG